MNSPTRPTIIDNRYLVGRRIGRGGMADVFLAHDNRDNREVAVKVLFAEYATDPNFVERFRREAQAAASLDHPNIVDVFDWGRHGSTYYIAMEYVDGRTLADILRANGSLTSKQAAEIAGEVAAALGFAHAAGLVHRDIKPANILVGTNGSVKVADFGIARALNSATESQLTQVGAVMGTATYFSPEQAQGAQPDPRSDLYSLGVVMYEMLAGRPPFLGDNPVAIAYKQVHDYPTPLNQLVADVPRPYEAIVAKLLTKDPNVRYSTADSLREDLRRFRNGDMPIALQSAAASARQTNQHNVATTMQPATGGRGEQTMVGGPGGRGPNRPPTGAVRRTPPPGYDKRDRARTGWYALAAFFALVALGIGGFLLYNALTGDGEQDSNRVPDLIGTPLQDATAELGRRNLSFAIEFEDNDQFGPGIVHRTDPIAGTLVQSGTPITLYATPDETLATIPDLRGQTVEQARQALADAGFLAVSVTEEDDESVDAGRVIRTDPPAGESHSVTDPITIVARAESVDPVATTAAPTTTSSDLVRVPQVIGETETEARNQLAAAGFEVEVVFFDGYAAQVLDQDPKRGTMLERGETVTINVGRGIVQPTNPPQTNPPATNPPATAPPVTTTTTTAAPPPATQPPVGG